MSKIKYSPNIFDHNFNKNNDLVKYLYHAPLKY